MRILIHASVHRAGIQMLATLFFFLQNERKVHAQWIKRPVISSGIQAALPMKEFKTFASFGLGVQVEGESHISPQLVLVGSTGWTHFLGKDYGAGKTKGTHVIPLLFGARVYPIHKIFLGVLAGLGFMAAGKSSETGFSYVPHIGYGIGRAKLILSYHFIASNGTTYMYPSLVGLYTF